MEEVVVEVDVGWGDGAGRMLTLVVEMATLVPLPLEVVLPPERALDGAAGCGWIGIASCLMNHLPGSLGSGFIFDN